LSGVEALTANKRGTEAKMAENSTELLRRWQRGDQSAATTLFNRYFLRLHAFAGTQLSARLAARLDADDVVQSAFHIFFHGARDGRYVLQRTGDLWRLLTAIAIHQLQHEHKRHSAGKRAFEREQLPLPLRDAYDEEGAWLADEPTPEDAALLTDEVQLLLRPLNERQRRMVELRLQGFTLEETAVEVRCDERTVRRTMEQVKAQLEERLRHFDRA
jgi:RNA polymerase sigma factor (sigma-70 family)